MYAVCKKKMYYIHQYHQTIHALYVTIHLCVNIYTLYCKKKHYAHMCKIDFPCLCMDMQVECAYMLFTFTHACMSANINIYIYIYIYIQDMYILGDAVSIA